jgi:hypothetical protein
VQLRDAEVRLKSQIELLIKTGEGRANVVPDMIERLFPAAIRHIKNNHYGPDWERQWLRERRVAHKEFLRLYLERVAGDGLMAFTDAERAWACMFDRSLFEKYLESIDPPRLGDVINSLEIYEDQFTPDQVVPGATVLLNLMSEIPERQRGMFDIGGRLVVSRVVLRLLRSLNDPAGIEIAVRQILPNLRLLSSAFDLIRIVGHREGAGHKLVPEEIAADLEKCWRAQVRAKSVQELVQEPDPLQLVLFAKRESGPSEPAVAVPDTPELTLALLRSAYGEATSQSMGSRAIRRSPRLSWDALIEVFGSEETLRNRLMSLKGAAIVDAGDLLALADKYANGWRPNRLGF